jgi:hypothetical protein
LYSSYASIITVQDFVTLVSGTNDAVKQLQDLRRDLDKRIHQLARAAEEGLTDVSVSVIFSLFLLFFTAVEETRCLQQTTCGKQVSCFAARTHLTT